MYETFIKLLSSDYPTLAFTGLFFALFTIAVILAFLFSWIWAWVDDAEKVKENFILKGIGDRLWSLDDRNLLSIIKKRYGRRTSNEDTLVRIHTGKISSEVTFEGLSSVEIKQYSKIRLREGGDSWVTYFVSLFWIWVAVISAIYYFISIWVISTIALATLARFSRRLQKRFVAHVADDKVHNVEPKS